jgi:hypothetical protein
MKKRNWLVTDEEGNRHGFSAHRLGDKEYMLYIYNIVASGGTNGGGPGIADSQDIERIALFQAGQWRAAWRNDSRPIGDIVGYDTEEDRHIWKVATKTMGDITVVASEIAIINHMMYLFDTRSDISIPDDDQEAAEWRTALAKEYVAVFHSSEWLMVKKVGDQEEQ